MSDETDQKSAELIEESHWREWWARLKMQEFRRRRERFYQVNWGWFQLSLWLGHGWWFRLFGRGASFTDHRVARPLFSERYNGQHGLRHETYVHVGPYCLHLLTHTPRFPAETK